MAITDAPPQSAAGQPSRFREAEPRGIALAASLRRFTHVDAEIDEQLMARLGAALLQRDELGAALADAIRMRGDDPDKVTQSQLRVALRDGLGALGQAPPALVSFITEVSHPPAWVDWDLVDQGGRLLRRMGPTAHDVMEQLSLVGGYRFGGPTDLLVATGGLTGHRTRRRLAETQHWAVELSEPGALRPGGEGWRLTVHVRVMHAMVNAAYEPRWDVARWGLPINQADQAGTLGLFYGTPLIACRGLGMPISADDAHAFMHMWKVVGWLLGVDPAFLTDDEAEGYRLMYHILVSAPNVTDAGPQLARAVLTAVGSRQFAGWPGALQRVRGAYEQERFLSMLTGFVGPTGMRDLGLGLRPPWAFAAVLPANLLRYRIIDHLPGGIERRERWGGRVQRQLLASYFGPEAAGVGGLPD